MPPPLLTPVLAEELSSELAKEHAIAITRHHRIQGSRGYRDAAEWVLYCVNWIDGERTITDLCRVLSARFGPLALADVARAVEDLVAAGVATWR
jgi:hypothetical protein